MKPELKARWTAALRSGEYNQTTGWFRTEDGFCCLGVACEVFGDEIGLKSEPVDYMSKNHWVYGNRSDNLPLKMVNLLEIDETGRLNKAVQFEGEECTTLQCLNDAGMPFAQIADVIEEQF
jgi:hypothetical protein